jgi:hypothetical protein
MRQLGGVGRRWVRGPVGTLRAWSRRQPGDETVEEPTPLDVDPVDREIVERCMPYSMTGAARLQAAVDAVAYCERRGVPGAFVECGVWRGGSVLAMVLKLQSLGRTDREIHLYDTFEGMTAPSEHDTSRYEGPATATWAESTARGERAWGHVFGAEVFDERSVRALLVATGYPEERLHIVKGPVEDTIPEQAPSEVALLRLDTDWYESTRHELEHLYPRLHPGGVLIIDDYGHWEGARQAVDEYFDGSAAPILLNRIDYTGRVGVKH